MPYKDKAKQLEAWRKAQEKKRQKDVIPSTDVIPEIPTVGDVNPVIPDLDVIPSLPPEWAHVAEFISRPIAPGQTLTNLEKLRRIAGSLGKYADDVWFGGLTMGEIGRVLGTEKPELEKKRPY